MAISASLACTRVAMVDEANPNRSYTDLEKYQLTRVNGQRYVVLSFASVPAEHRQYKISAFKLTAKVEGAGDYTLYGASEAIPNPATWANLPKLNYIGYARTYLETAGLHDLEFTPGRSDSLDYLAYPGFAISAEEEFASQSISAKASGAAADYRIDYDYDTTVIDHSVASTANFQSGWLNPHIANAFRWIFEHSESREADWSLNTMAGFTQSSAVFYWREQGADSWNAIHVTGAAQEVSVPADTFPSGTIQWYVSATDTLGHTSQTAVCTLSTSDTLRTTVPISPVSSVEDGSAPITFRWTSSNSTGTAPTGFKLWWKRPDSQYWSVAAEITGSAQSSYTVPAGTFPAGEIQWIVRTYNADGDPGPWSSQDISFICVAAPDAPIVNTDAAPFATITWQADIQEAYRLTVDGTAYGPFWGSEKSFTLPNPLTDGEHTARVEVQGLYGLWSRPGETVFRVANVPGADLTLLGSFGTDAELSWETAEQNRDYLIYRDGVQIGHTAGLSFTDRLVLGEHSWRVINRLPDGNYTASNEISGTPRSCVTQIAPAVGGTWLPLKLSENSMDAQIFSYTRSISLRHMNGAEYPIAELSPYLDGSGTYNVAFSSPSQAQAFEALRGQVVIIKSRGGNVLIGVLSELRKRAENFFVAFDFTVQRCHWEDYVDDTND